MSKIPKEIRAEIFGGEAICGNCKLFWKNTAIKNFLSDCGAFDTDDNARCEFEPSRFSPSHGEEAGNTIRPKDLKEDIPTDEEVEKELKEWREVREEDVEEE